MISYIPILLLLFRTIESALLSEYNTVVAIKKGVTSTQPYMAIGAQNYTALVQQSEIFVDTSLFIETIIEGNCSKPRVLLTPRKWGKTINLDMFKTFLEIQVDNEGAPLPRELSTNYRLFKNGEVVLDNGQVQLLEKPLLISENTDLMESHQGRVPIIYFTFKRGLDNHVKTIKDSVIDAVKGAYMRHKYIEKILPTLNLDSAELTIIRKIFQSDTGDYNHYKNGITLLCKVLHAHFKRKPIVIMEDYDRPLWSILQTGQTGKAPDKVIEDILYVLERFIEGTFVYNPDIEHAIISGVQAVGRVINGTDRWYYYLHDCTRKNKPLCEYFGFNHETVDVLFDKYAINPPLRERARKWYDGFESRMSSMKFYAPLSISYFLREKKIANYWNSNEDRILSRKFFRYFYEMLIQFIGGEEKSVCSGACIGLHVSQHIRDAFLPIEFFHYLFRMGYFTVAAEQFRDDFYYTRIKLPNHEIAFEISGWVLTNYQRLYRYSSNLLEEAAIKLLQIVENDSNITALVDSFDQALQCLYQNSTTPIIIQTTTTNTIPFYPNVMKDNPYETPFHSVLNSVALKMQCLTDFEVNVFYNKLREADVVIFNNKTRVATVLELSSKEESPEIPLNTTLRYNLTFDDLGGVKTVNLIGLVVLENKSVHSATKSVPRE